MNAPKKISENKRRIVADLSEKLAKAEGIILTEYAGMTVADLTALRLKLRRIQGELRILQNRLTKIAMKDMKGAEGIRPHLKGPTAAVISYGDPILLARTVKEFAADVEKFRIKAAYVSGRTLTPPEILRLADLPGRGALIAQIVGLAASPFRRLVTALSQPHRGLVQVLAQVAKKKGS